MSFPVYVLLSKCDLIAGFKEFFSELSKEECEQVWGVTFEGVNDYDSVVEGFNEEFHKLINNVNARVNARLLTERNQSAKQVIYEFPKQLRLLQSKIDGFLKEIFSTNNDTVDRTLWTPFF
jgi:type VI secretion system protein ImpL